MLQANNLAMRLCVIVSQLGFGLGKAYASCYIDFSQGKYDADEASYPLEPFSRSHILWNILWLCSQQNSTANNSISNEAIDMNELISDVGRAVLLEIPRE